MIDHASKVGMVVGLTTPAISTYLAFYICSFEDQQDF